MGSTAAPRLNDTVALRMTSEERRLALAAADLRGATLSGFAREAIVDAARRELGAAVGANT